MRDRELYCDDCQAEVLFEAPPCPDGHGEDCPELVCTQCGAALLIAVTAPSVRAVPRATRSRRGIHPGSRRAA